mgnify:CR=1 FL=1
MWLNFLPIFDKEQQKFDFAKIRDAQYHMALYELLAELNYKHSAILKKRQIASSYYHMAKFINTYWFESGAVLKLGASLKDYINEKGSWKFLDEYKTIENDTLNNIHYTIGSNIAIYPNFLSNHILISIQKIVILLII